MALEAATSYREKIQELWRAVGASPGAKRESRLFHDAEILGYRVWLGREISLPESERRAGKKLPYHAFLRCLLGDALPESLDENSRELLTQRLHDRVMQWYAPDAESSAAAAVKNHQEKVLKSRLRSQAKFLQFLNLLIRLGNIQKLWKWCPPSVPRLLERESTPFTSEGLEGYRYVQAARALVWEDFRKGIRPDAFASEGRILLSAALYGGLGEVAALRELQKSLRGGVALEHFPQLGWSFLDLEIPMGRGGTRLRRWFLDPMSEIFFLNHIGNSPLAPESSRTEVMRAIDAYLHTLPKRHGKYLRARKLVAAIPQSLLVGLPQYLAAYAAGTLAAHAVRSERWWRMHGYQWDAQDGGEGSHETREEQEALSAPDAQDVSTGAGVEVQEAIQSVAWLQSLRKILSNQNRMAASQELAKTSANVGADRLGRLFYGWAEHLLKNGSAYRHRLAMRTIRRYVSRLAALMAQLLENPADVDNFGDPSWRQLYEDLLDLVETEHQRAFLVRAIREWHQYLVERHLASPISDQELGEVTMDVVPDARIVSEQEFEQIKQAIVQGQHRSYHAQLPTVLTLIAILGYRCGLRRMEVLRLRLMDCHLFGKAILLIRPFAERSLKSRNATRAIPLHALLKLGELQLLREWVHSREKSSGGGEGYLFALVEIGHDPISQEMAMSRVHDVMRQVTGDRGIHFHHLRHSFANHLLWRLSLPQIPADAVPKYLRDEREAAEKFVSQLLGSAGPTRKHLYALTSLLGHSTPDITLNHYVHNLDLLLALYLRGQIPRGIGRDWQGFFHQIHQATIYRAWAKAGTEGLLELMRRQHREKVRVSREIDNSKTSCRSDRTNEVAELEAYMENAWQILLQGMVLQKETAGKEDPWDRLAEESQFSSAHLRAMAAKATEIFTLRGHGGLRHSAYQIPAAGGRLKLDLPPKIHRLEDQQIYRELLPGFWRSLQKDRGALDRVLNSYLRQAWRMHPGYFLGKSAESPEEILAFRSLLFDWGIRPGQIRYVNYDPAERSVWRQRWREALGLHKKISIMTRHSPDPGLMAAWLHVYPGFDRRRSGELSASPGFSYLLIMGAIVLRAVAQGLRSS